MSAIRARACFPFAFVLPFVVRIFPNAVFPAMSRSAPVGRPKPRRTSYRWANRSHTKLAV